MSTFEGDSNPKSKLQSCKPQQIPENSMDLNRNLKRKCSEEGEKTLALDSKVSKLKKRGGILQACIDDKNEPIDSLKDELDWVKAMQVEDVASLTNDNLKLKGKLVEANLLLKWIGEESEKLNLMVVEQFKFMEIS